MSGVPSRGLSPATLALLADLGGSASPVTGGREPATALSKTVTTNKSFKSCSYLNSVTGAHVLPHQVGPSDTWEERAAIFEFEGGLSRPFAEAMATRLVSIGATGSSAARAALDRDLIELERLRP